MLVSNILAYFHCFGQTHLASVETEGVDENMNKSYDSDGDDEKYDMVMVFDNESDNGDDHDNDNDWFMLTHRYANHND